jgi:hypothetical protein
MDKLPDTLSLRAAHGQMVRLAAARACSKYSSAFATLCSGCRLRRCSAMHRRTGQGSRSCLIAASVGGNYFEIESSDRINVGCWAIRRDPAQSPDGRGIARPANGGRKPINANCETVEGLPTFRDAYRRRRCMLPVDCFFEWKAIKGQKAKQPYAIAMKDSSSALEGRGEHRFRLVRCLSYG